MKKKGFSLIEVLVAMSISGIIIVVFGFLMDKAINVNRGIGKNNDVLSGGLILQDVMYKNMRYTSPNLVNLYTIYDDSDPNDKTKNHYAENECWAVGFPVLNLHSSDKLTINPRNTGYDLETFKCLNANEKLLPKNWDGYILYVHDKEGEYFFKERNYFYEVRFKYTNDEDNRNILVKYTNTKWGEQLDIEYKPQSNFYKKVLNKLLSNVDKNQVRVLSKSVKSFRVATNLYPAIKMGVLLTYGIYSGSYNLGNNKKKKISAKKDEYTTENFELNWTVLPLN